MQKPWSKKGSKTEHGHHHHLHPRQALKKKNKCNSGMLFGHFRERFWGPFWDQIGQRGGKMSPREPSGASKSQKAAFSKTLKNLEFFSVFGSRGFQENLKRPEKAPKRHPKRYQRWSKTWSKSGQKVNPKLSKKNG